MKLTELFPERAMSADLKAVGKLGLLHELAQLIARAHEEANPEILARALLERERVMTTALGFGVALPHAKTSEVDRLVGSLGIHRAGVDFDAEDGSRTHIFFALLAPEEASKEHAKVLSYLSKLIQDGKLRKALREAESCHALLQILREAEAGG